MTEPVPPGRESEATPPSDATQAYPNPETPAPSPAEAPTLAPLPAYGAAPAVSLPATFGRYRLLRELGRGGMGTVYLAEDSQLERRVALKVPRISADDPAALRRFYREARAAALLSHPNLCPVYDVGDVGGVPYLTMPFLDGTPLCDHTGSVMDPMEAAKLVRRLALALAEAHRHGIIHRDLKPGNVMVTSRGEPVVMDFGLARRTQQDEARLTQSGTVVGTPAYMPPEQVEATGAPLGPACDIYSLGVILYELLTGRLPFQGTSMQVMCQILRDDPPPPSLLRPGLDPRLEAICRKAMAKVPNQRYASMSDLAAALDDYEREPELLEALPAGPVLSPRREAEAADETLRRAVPRPPSADRLGQPRPRRRWGCAAGCGLALLLTCGLPVVLLTLAAPRAGRLIEEAGGWLQEEMQRQQQWAVIEAAWVPPPADVASDRLFPARVAQFERREHDAQADVPEFDLHLDGRRARYSDGAHTLEVCAYSTTDARKSAAFRRVMEKVKGRPNHFISGSEEGSRVVFNSFGDQEGVLWYRNGWLFFARSHDGAKPEEFLLQYLPMLGPPRDARERPDTRTR